MSYEIKKNGRKYDVVDGEGNVLASLSKKNAAQTWIQRKIAKDREEFKNMVENAAVESVEVISEGQKPKPKKEPKPKPEPKTKYTRIDAFLQAFTELNEKGFTKEQIIQRADDIYVENGTGEEAENGEGRPTPWTYKHPKYGWVTTRGMVAQPYMRPAADNNREKVAEELGVTIGHAVTAGAKND